MEPQIPSPIAGGARFTFAAAFRLGWRTVRAHYGLWVAAMLSFVLLMFAAQGVGSQLGALAVARGFHVAQAVGVWMSAWDNHVAQSVGSWLGAMVGARGNHMPPVFALIAVNTLFVYPLAFGLPALALRRIRGDEARLGALFHGFRCYWPLVGILYVILALPALVLNAVAGPGLGSAGGMAMLFSSVALAAALFLLVRLSLAPLLCMDAAAPGRGATAADDTAAASHGSRGLGFIASLATSWRRSGAVFFRLLAVYLVLAGILVLGFAGLPLAGLSPLGGVRAVGFGLILAFGLYGAPLVAAVYAAAYTLIMEEAAADHSP